MNTKLDEARQAILETRQKTYDLLRIEGIKHLYIFNKYVLGAEEGNNKVSLAPFHKELCKFIDDARDKRKLVLVPRLHLKSTLVTIGYAIMRIVQDPNVRILILSGTYQNAIDFVGAIKDHLSRNQTLIELFGDLSKNPINWADDRFTLSTARTAIGDKEPTVLGAGIESNVVSKHFDIIIFDDIVVRENTETRDQIEKVIKRYRDASSLLEKGGSFIVIGTRWTDDDLYSWLLDKENQQIQGFDTFIRPAMKWDGPIENALKTGNGFQESLWPDKFDREELLKRYIGLGPYNFSTQFLNDPVPETDATFKAEWFHSYEETDIRHDFINNYLTIDPAISTSKEADFTAMVVTGIDRWGNIYVRDIVRGKFKPDELINEIFRLAETWHPKIIGIEDVVFQKTLVYSAREQMRIRERNLPIVPVKPQNRSKDERIRGLQPLYANGKIFHNSSHPMIKYLEDELKRFPRGKNDDMIDALSYTLDFFTKPKPKKNYSHKYLY